MEKIYLSGVISLGGTCTPEEREQNKRKFYRMTAYLKLNHDWEVINPLDLPKLGDFSWKNCMIVDIKALVDCDGIYMMKGWHHSEGANLEYHIAKRLGLKIYFES
jgi:hypothetical protein